MDGARHQFFSGAAFAGDQHRRARIFQARDHAQHILNFGRRADDAVQAGFSVHALPQKLILLHQADFLRHAAQKQAQLFQRRKRLADVVVGPQLHRLHRGFDRPMAGHHRDFGAGQQLLHLLQKLQAGHVGHDHIGEDHVRGMFFQQSQRGFAAVGFQAGKPQRFAYGHAEFADTLLVIHHQQTDSKVFAHSAFPIVSFDD